MHIYSGNRKALTSRRKANMQDHPASIPKTIQNVNMNVAQKIIDQPIGIGKLIKAILSIPRVKGASWAKATSQRPELHHQRIRVFSEEIF